MKLIKAKVLDSTHLELSQPITPPSGELIEIVIPDDEEEEQLWRRAGRDHLPEAYDPQDAIYDKL